MYQNVKKKDGEDWHLVAEEAPKCRHHRLEIRETPNKSSALSTQIRHFSTVSH